MNKKILMLLLLPGFSYASDPLIGTSWRTIDDRNNEATSIVQFNEDKNGNLTAKINKILVPGEEEQCKSCKGRYHNKSLIGLVIIQNLKKGKDNKYEGGEILDPETGKIYKFNAKLINNGKTLVGRGYIGISLIGRSETWHRIN